MQPCSYEWYNRRNPTVDGRRIVTLLEQVVTHAEWRGDGAPKPSLLSSKLVHRLGPASADTLVLPRERVPKLPTSVVHDVVRLQATGGLTPRQAMEPLPAVCCSRYRPVVEMSGHRWMAAYCLQFDASGRAIVSGADDQLRTPGPGMGMVFRTLVMGRALSVAAVTHRGACLPSSRVLLFLCGIR